ncbi:helix-turn-helix domain-containing protein [Lacticaseibacillus mingshuiensis]|uniref:Helix-turn-helix domain-containing protein n=1 Tax=Lacticaseibacillus mingshuiensis TaxID=2799574 RepID=A0ABW4CEG0_9LACO|nr:helix-turn-helix transcriptional regulator [Lacticaseibacillus mingshuiensis]
MSKDLNEFMMENSESLDDFFSEMMKDSSYRQAYQAEMNRLSSAAALVEAREAAGLSQQKLAEKAGVPKTTVSRIERGQNTSIDTLTKLANALGQPIVLTIGPVAASKQ